MLVERPHSLHAGKRVLEPLSGYLLPAMRACSRRQSAGGGNSGPANAGRVSVHDLLRRVVRERGGGSGRVHHDEGAPREAGYPHPDIAASVNSSGWRPVMGIEESVAATVREYRRPGDRLDPSRVVPESVESSVKKCRY